MAQYLAIIWNNQCYQYLVIYVTYMQPGWTFTDEPECLAYHNIWYLVAHGQSNSLVKDICHKLHCKYLNSHIIALCNLKQEGI